MRGQIASFALVLVMIVGQFSVITVTKHVQVVEITDETQNVFAERLPSNQPALANERELIFTWTSLDSPTAQSVSSGDRIVGDQITLHATIPDINWSSSLDIIELIVELWDVNGEYVIIWSWEMGNSITMNTYGLGNVLLRIDIHGEAQGGEEYDFQFTSIELINHFAPNVTILTPSQDEVVVNEYNVSWTVTDRNSEGYIARTDVHVVIEGVNSFYIATSDLGLNETWFSWDSTLWGPPEHRPRAARILVEVTDETNLFGAAISDLFTMGRPSDQSVPTIDDPDDAVFAEGQVAAAISWQPRDDFPLRYRVFVNGLRIVNEIWDGSDVIFPVNELARGNHTVSIVVYDQGGNSIADTVMVSIVEALFDYTGILVVVGSAVIIGVIVLMLGMEYREWATRRPKRGL